jgi:lysozyme
MIREELIDLLTVHEGKRLKPYRDSVGKLTIGVGRNLDDVGISEAEANDMLYHDLDRVWGQITSKYPWFEKLDEVRQDVVLSMVFNIGIRGFGEFKNLIASMEKGNYIEARINMLDSGWARQVGNRAKDLAYMMSHGTYLTREQLGIK